MVNSRGGHPTEELWEFLGVDVADLKQTHRASAHSISEESTSTNPAHVSIPKNIPKVSFLHYTSEEDCFSKAAWPPPPLPCVH